MCLIKLGEHKKIIMHSLVLTVFVFIKHPLFHLSYTIEKIFLLAAKDLSTNNSLV